MCSLLIGIHLLNIFISLVSSKYSGIEEIKNVFGTKTCIEGSLSTLSSKSHDNLMRLEESSANISNTSSTEVKHEKSATSKLHELAQYNEIKYFYKLEQEEGPPHNKLFTVSLKLGDEEFVGEGTTIKKAQNNVANIALENTDYEPPPFKDQEVNTEVLTPTVLLNNLGAKLGIQVSYYLIDKDKKGILNTKLATDGQFKKSYLQKLNASIYDDNDIHIRRDAPQSGGPFKVMVEVGDKVFYGVSYTVQSARHEAASKAVDHLIKIKQDGNIPCTNEDSEECEKAKANIKSPISLIYEAGQLRNLEVDFKVIKEEGPSHKKTFTTQCKLGHLTTTGVGTSKKESKHAAALDMVGKLSELPEVPQEVVVKNLLKEKQRKKKKKKVIKTKLDMINMHIDNFIESVIESVPVSSSKDGTETDSPKSKKTNPGKSYQDKILELSNLLNFETQFSDFDENERFFSVLSLHINPHYICLGQGPSKKIARNKAAEGGLKLLRDVPLDSYLQGSKQTLLESEVKEQIYLLLNQDIYEEK